MKRIGGIAVVLLGLSCVDPSQILGGPTRGHDTRAAVEVHEKVDINSADVKELMTLDGVGRKLAEKIVEYRHAHGPFKKAEELRKVDGVGAGLWERNRDRVVAK